MKRRLIQLCAALLYNLNLKGFAEASIYKGRSKGLCVPGLNCYSCPGAVGSCPLGTLQNALSAMDRKLPFYILGVLLLFGVTMGRTICGFLCPFGLVQELLYKIPVPKIKKNRVTQELSKVKYVILAVFVIILPVVFKAASGLPVPAFCKYICPAGTLEGGTSGRFPERSGRGPLSLEGSCAGSHTGKRLFSVQKLLPHPLSSGGHLFPVCPCGFAGGED